MSIKSKFSKLSIALLAGAAIGATAITSGSANADEIYTVKSGDTLSEISYAFNLDGNYDAIAQANHIKDVNFITVGQKLVIKDNGSIKKATKSEIKSLPEVDKNTNAAAATKQATPAKAATPKATPAKTASYNGGSSVSSVANEMASRTGVSAAKWQQIIMRESGGNANISNASSGAYGLFQLLGHGEHPGMSVADQINMATNVYNAQGLSAWGE